MNNHNGRNNVQKFARIKLLYTFAIVTSGLKYMKNIQWLYIALLAVCLQAHAQQNNMQRAQQILQWMKMHKVTVYNACFDAQNATSSFPCHN